MPIVDPTTNPVIGDYEVTAVDFALLSDGSPDGNGIFDVLMRATRAHIEKEFKLGRFKGAEFSTVYLGAMDATLKTALGFLLARRTNAYEAELAKQKVANAILEGKVLIAQECKLRAEFDVLGETLAKTTEEKLLLAQKTVTERAQTQAVGVDADSVIGRQKLLYSRQADGFLRDAEQKAAKALIDSWNVRRTTDEGTVADNTNKLADTFIGQAVTKLLAGIQA